MYTSTSKYLNRRDRPSAGVYTGLDGSSLTKKLFAIQLSRQLAKEVTR